MKTKLSKPKRSLTEKRRHFCELYVGDVGLRGNATGCYDQAYPSARRKIETTRKNAHQLLEQPPVIAYLKELRAPAIKATKGSFNNHLTELAMLRDGAVQRKDFAAAIRAEELRGKASGHYVNKGDSNQVSAAVGVIRIPDPVEDQVKWQAMVKIDMSKEAVNA